MNIIASAFLNTQAVKDDLTEYKCLCCNKTYLKVFVENVKKHLLIHKN